MNEITTFTNQTLGSVRSIITEDDEIWFVAKDIADALGYQDTEHMIRRLDEDEIKSSDQDSSPHERGSNSNNSVELPNILGNKKTIYINEPGLYRSILGSKKPEAKEFKRWVTHEVLPSIRKTGSYSVYGNEDLTKISRDLLKAVSIVNTRVSNIESDVSQLKSEVQLIKSSISDKVHIPTDQLDYIGKCNILYDKYLELDKSCSRDGLTNWLYRGYGKAIGKNIILNSARRRLDPLEYLNQLNELSSYYDWSIKYINEYLESININPIEEVL